MFPQPDPGQEFEAVVRRVTDCQLILILKDLSHLTKTKVNITMSVLTWRPFQLMGIKVGPRDRQMAATVGQALESQKGLWVQSSKGVLVEYKVYSSPPVYYLCTSVQSVSVQSPPLTNNGRIINNPSSRTHSSTKGESGSQGTPSM